MITEIVRLLDDMKTTLSPFEGPSGPGKGKKGKEKREEEEVEEERKKRKRWGKRIGKIKEVFGKRKIHSIKYKIQTYKGIDA